MIKKFINKLNNDQRTQVVLFLDAALSAICFHLSLALRLGDFQSFWHNTNYWYTLLLVVVLQTSCFYFSGLYRGIWRFASIPDLIRLAKGISMAVLLTLVALFFATRLDSIPRTTFFIDWMLLLCSLGGMRFTYRIWRDHAFTTSNNENATRVIIVGAGSGGEQLFRELREDVTLNLKVMGFIDDDLGKRNKILHGVPVLGAVNDLPKIITKTQATQVYIAIPSASGDQIRRIVELCKNSDVKFKTLPRMKDFLKNKSEYSQLRDIRPEDLLGRKEIQLDRNTLGSMLTGKVIMITGAGGSIGSELCTQIAQYAPAKLVFYEMTEFFLFQLERKFADLFPKLQTVSIIGDIRDEKSLEQAFIHQRPQVVLHAAAYKHVPLMETNPKESIKTNVAGTQLLSNLAKKYHVERFVQVSTDKAVNPTNIMGASKRLAEMVTQENQEKNGTKFMTVRFGNVLGSSGSVIPIFEEQIKNGGPVKVTHPEIKRYFMSIPEASQLVLQAGAIGNGGEIFVLDMGEPIMIADLAVQMIRMNGLRPGVDIQIEYTGLRPGEKLFEELFVNDEHTLPTLHPLVRVAKARVAKNNFKQLIGDFLENIPEMSNLELIHALKTFIPEYSPDEAFHMAKSDVNEEIDPTLSNLQ